MSNPKRTDIKFNETVTAFFQTYTGNFMTQDIDEARLREIKDGINKIKVGDVLLLKKSKNPNSSGKHTYFLEIADPKTFTNRKPQVGSDNDL